MGLVTYFPESMNGGTFKVSGTPESMNGGMFKVSGTSESLVGGTFKVSDVKIWEQTPKHQ